MKIGVDVTPLTGQQTGVGNYLYYLLKELVGQRCCDEFYLYGIRKSPWIEALKGFSNVTVRLSVRCGFSEALWSQTTLAYLAWKDQLDWFWGATQSIPLCNRKGQKNLLTLHDFAYLLYPHTVSTVRGTFLRLLGKKMYRKADALVAISQGSAKKLKEYFGLTAQAVIIPPLKEFALCDRESLLASHQLQYKRYYVIAATLEPRKNLEAALEAYQELIPEVDPLVLVGKLGWKHQTVVKQLKKLTTRFPQHVKALGYLPDAHLNTLIQSARAYLMPSLYEGYGMPLAEARTLGTPVIYSASEEMREAAEDDGLTVDLSNFKHAFQQALRAPLSAPSACHYLPTATLAATLSHIMQRGA